MQFAKVQGSALAVLGLLLLALQGYLYVSGLRPAERPTAQNRVRAWCHRFIGPRAGGVSGGRTGQASEERRDSADKDFLWIANVIQTARTVLIDLTLAYMKSY
jgi:hypothetical protein